MKLLKNLLALIGTLVPFALVVVLYLMFRAEDLTGLKDARAATRPGRDLLAEVAATLDRGHPFACDEAALNAHLARVLHAREGDGFEMFADFEGLWVRLFDGHFEVVFERQVLGVDSTVAARVELTRAEGGHGFKVTGGRFGELPVPAGAMHLLRGGLGKLAAALEPEKSVLSEVRAVRISPGHLRLERSSGRPQP